MSLANATSRQRSPNFPYHTLEAADHAALTLYDKDRRAIIAREVAAKHLGFAGLNGSAKRILATLNQFGLVEDLRDGRLKVSPLGEAIAHPKDAGERYDLLRQALQNPRIFRSILDQFSDGELPSKETLVASLVREYRFTRLAAEACAKSLSESLRYVRQHGADSPARESDHGAGDEGLLGRQAAAADESSLCAWESIVVRLGPETLGELRIRGAFGPPEVKRFKKWLDAVATPWAEFMVVADPADADEP